MNGPKSPVHFITSIKPGCSCQLSVPVLFRKYLKDIRETKPAIFKRGYQKWSVEINDSWKFGDGWEDFVRENDIEDHDTIVFKHEGGMVFDTILLDSTRCEKEYPPQNVIVNVNMIPFPYFKSVITSYGMSDSYMTIPKAFARSNGLFGMNCESVVVDEKGFEWPTKLCTNKHGALRLRGMKKIWDTNGLKIGDEFLLELINSGEKPRMILRTV